MKQTARYLAMRSTRLFFGLSILIITGACTDDKEVIFELLPASKTGIDFNNEIVESADFSGFTHMYAYNGSGVGVLDVNNDKLPDLFFAGCKVSSKLYLNQGNLKFEDITENAGVSTENWATGVSVVDINADGYHDIYVCMADKDFGEVGKNKLYINQGDNTFKEQAEAYGLADASYSTQAVFFDYDLDGDLDMYLLNNAIDNIFHNAIRPRKTNGTGLSNDKLYRNNGDGSFADVTEKAGILTEGYGLGIGVIDINKDGWPDIYCSNDFITNDLLWLNNGDGTFTESIRTYFTQTSKNGMGMDIADYNNDGLLDLVQVDMLPESNHHNKTMTPAMNYNGQTMRYEMDYMPQFTRNTLQRQNTRGDFSEIGRSLKVHKTDWSWAPLLADYNNDGHKDLFIANGYGRDVTDLDYINYLAQNANPFGTEEARKTKGFEKFVDLKPIYLPNYFFKNSGDGSFEDVTVDWSENKPSISNGAVYVDLDQDGDLDLVTNNMNERAFVYQNVVREKDTTSTNYLKIKLVGDMNNLDAIGAKATLYSGGEKQVVQNYAVRGYVSSMVQPLHFGMGSAKPDSLVVLWPDGKQTVTKSILANQTLVVSKANTKEWIPTTKEDVTPIFVKNGVDFANIVHRENDYIDFMEQPLLLKMLSREGPGMAVADLDNDGDDDLVVTSAYKDTTFIWFQNAAGQLEKGVPLSDSWKHEQLGVVAADFNNDGLNDIYITSGGNEFHEKSDAYQDKLYYQTAAGTFEPVTDLPTNHTSAATVNAADFDRDGDLDLFVGSRLKPKNYPKSDASHLLCNEEGKWIDCTAKLAPELEHVGLVSAALWTDYDNDNDMDLIIVGEWTDILFFENVDAKLQLANNKLEIPSRHGFWNSITGIDFDKDGDTDYILGNYGTNSDLKATDAEPIRIIAKDYDRNGVVDPIIGYYSQGTEYPYAGRDAITSQIVGLKKRFPSYAEYADAEFDRLFTVKEHEGELVRTVNSLSSIVLLNHGSGRFETVDLSNRVQESPVYGIVTMEVDGDGNEDVLLVGNRTDTETLGGSLDASLGTILLGNDTHLNNIMEPQHSGFDLGKTPHRSMVKMRSDSTTIVFVGNNDGRVDSFSKVGKAKRWIQLRSDDVGALITLKNGATYKKEFYYGAGYLSQDSRKFEIPISAKEIKVFNSKGDSRSYRYD